MVMPAETAGVTWDLRDYTGIAAPGGVCLCWLQSHGDDRSCKSVVRLGQPCSGSVLHAPAERPAACRHGPFVRGRESSVDSEPGTTRLTHLAYISAHFESGAPSTVIVPTLSIVTGAVSFIAHILKPTARKAHGEPAGSDAMRYAIGRAAEYLDGLPASEPVVRGPFELGLAAMRACRWDDAVSYFRQAMTLTNGVHLVALLNLIGVCRYTQGRADDALSDFEESAALAERLQAKRGRAHALNNIGLIYRDRGELDRALACLEQSLAVAREFDDLWAMAIHLGNVGNIWHRKGDFDKALDCHERALAVAREIGDQWSVATELANIGGVYEDKGDLDKALKHDKQALGVARCIGYRLGVVAGLANLASVYRKQGRHDEALQHEEEALGIARRAGYVLGAAIDLGNIGLDLMSRERHAEAVPKLAEALTILLSVGVADGPRQALTGLVRCEDRLGRQRVQTQLRESGLGDGQIADLLSRVDQTRMRRPVSAEGRSLKLQAVPQ